jgi:hypothetical protein
LTSVGLALRVLRKTWILERMGLSRKARREKLVCGLRVIQGTKPPMNNVCILIYDYAEIGALHGPFDLYYLWRKSVAIYTVLTVNSAQYMYRSPSTSLKTNILIFRARRLLRIILKARLDTTYCTY